MLIGEAGSRTMDAREGVTAVKDAPHHGRHETNLLLAFIAIRLGAIERLLEDQNAAKRRLVGLDS